MSVKRCIAKYKIACLSNVKGGLIKALSDKPGTWLDQSPPSSQFVWLSLSLCNQCRRSKQYDDGILLQSASFSIYTNASRTWSDVGIHFASFANYTIDIFANTGTFFFHDKRVSLVRLKKSGAVTTSFWGRSITFVFAAGLCKNLPPLHHRTNIMDKRTYYTGWCFLLVRPKNE